MEYATLAEVKTYLDLKDIDTYDERLKIILDAGNLKCKQYTGATETDARLRYSICKYVEFNFYRKTGVNAEKDSDFTMEFSAGNQEGKFSDVPAEVLDIWDDYVQGKKDGMKITLI